MTGTFDEDDYLAPASGGVRTRPAWLRLGLPVAAIFLVAVGVAAAIGLTTEKVYQADAQIELMLPESLPAGAVVPAPAQRISFARSSAVASRAVDQLALLQDARFLTLQFRADYPAALDMREQIDVIDATLAREQVRLAEDRAAEAQQLRIQQTDLLARIETLGYQVAARNTVGLGLGDAQQDISAKQELYNLLVARLAAEEETTLPTTARVIASAVAPSRPVVPNWPILIAAASGIALLLSLLVVLFDWRRRRPKMRQ